MTPSEKCPRSDCNAMLLSPLQSGTKPRIMTTGPGGPVGGDVPPGVPMTFGKCAKGHYWQQVVGPGALWQPDPEEHYNLDRH